MVFNAVVLWGLGGDNFLGENNKNGILALSTSVQHPWLNYGSRFLCRVPQCGTQQQARRGKCLEVCILSSGWRNHHRYCLVDQARRGWGRARGIPGRLPAPERTKSELQNCTTIPELGTNIRPSDMSSMSHADKYGRASPVCARGDGGIVNCNEIRVGKC